MGTLKSITENSPTVDEGAPGHIPVVGCLSVLRRQCFRQDGEDSGKIQKQQLGNPIGEHFRRCGSVF